MTRKKPVPGRYETAHLASCRVCGETVWHVDICYDCRLDEDERKRLEPGPGQEKLW